MCLCTVLHAEFSILIIATKLRVWTFSYFLCRISPFLFVVLKLSVVTILLSVKYSKRECVVKLWNKTTHVFNESFLKKHFAYYLCCSEYIIFVKQILKHLVIPNSLWNYYVLKTKSLVLNIRQMRYLKNFNCKYLKTDYSDAYRSCFQAQN